MASNPYNVDIGGGAFDSYTGSDNPYDAWGASVSKQAKAEQEDEQRKKKAKQYTDRFFTSLNFDTQTKTIEALKRKADKGDLKSAYQLQALSTDERLGNVQMQPATTQLSNLQKGATFLGGVAESAIELPKELLGRGKTLVTNIATDKRRGPGADELIRRQEQAKQVLPQDIQNSRGGILQEDSLKLLEMVNSGAGASELRTFFDEAKKRKEDADKKTLASAVEAGSYVVGGGSLKNAFVKGGIKQAAKTGAITTASAAGGNVASELRINPDATKEDLFKSGLYGAAFGFGADLTATGIGAGYRAIKNTKVNPPTTSTTSRLSKSVADIDSKLASTIDPREVAQLTAKRRDIVKNLAEKDGLSVAEKFNNKVVDRSYTLRRRVNQAVTATGGNGQDYLDRLDLALGNVQRSSIMAEQYMKSNGFESVMQKVATKTRENEFAEYLLSKQREFRRQEAQANGKTLSKSFMQGADRDRATISAFADEYEPLAQELHQFSQKFLREMANPSADLQAIGLRGIITPDLAEDLIRRNPEYIPLNKVLDEVASTGNVTSSPGSLSKQTVVSKFTGAGGVEENPLVSIYEKSHTGFNQMSRQGTAQLIKDLKDLPDNPLGIRVLRDADKVNERISLRTALKESKPIKNELQRYLKTNSKKLKKLQVEMDRLNREGLAARLSQETGSELPEAFRYVTKTEVRNPVTVKGKKTQPLLRSDALTGTATNRLSTTGGVSVKKMLDALVTEDPTTVKRIRRMLEARAPKEATLLDEIGGLRNQLDELNAKRRAEYLRQRDLKDVPAKGKATISLQRNGQKEIIEVPEYMEKALKGLNQQQNNALVRGLFFLNRVRKLGFTGASPGFATRNIPRDLQQKTIVGRQGIKNLSPRQLFAGWVDAIRGTATSERAESLGAFGNLVDTFRGTKRSLDTMRSSGNAKSIIKNKITKPSELFRLVEDAVSLSETSSRSTSYRVAYQDVLKRTRDEEAAIRAGVQAARRDSTDFFVRGEYGDIIKAWGLYLNPAIQGTRRFGQALREQPARVTARTAAFMLGPAVATTAWNMGSPERREAYESIPQWERDSYFIIVGPNPNYNESTGKWEGIYKLPKAPGISGLANAAEDITRQALSEGIDVGSFVKELGFGVADTVIPEETLAGAITPDPIEPLIQQVANKNFFTGKEIVPESESFREAKEGYASDTAKKVSGALDKFGVKVSPLRVDALIRDYTGSAGQGVQNVVEKLLGSDNPGGRSYVDQIKGSFMGSYGGAKKEQVGNRVTTAVETKTDISSNITELVRAGNIDEASRLAEEYNKKIEELRKYAEASREAKLSEKQNKLLDSLKFPVSNGRLSDSSIKSRLEN